MSISMLQATAMESLACVPAASWHSPIVYFSALGALVAIGWALTERSERRACLKQSSSLSDACRQLTEQHYRERVQAEERHLLAHDSTVRNVLESLERALLGKPRS